MDTTTDSLRRSDCSAETMTEVEHAETAVSETQATTPAAQEEEDVAATGEKPDYYFDSYSHYGIHEEMLKDKVRTESYRDAIYSNRHLFKDKVVLDVGCGTGILCMFAANAGARHVVGVDCSSIIEQAKQIVKENGFEDRITLIKGKMEEIKMPEGCEKVDIIVSEWMGYFLLYESMLNTVLWARDNYLVKGGLIFPDKSNMYICGIEDEHYREAKIDFWDDIYGFSFKSVKKVALLEPLVDMVESGQVSTTQNKFFTINLHTVKVEDLAFSKTYQISVDRKGPVHALVVYFDVVFSGHNDIVMTTSPKHHTTHWKQTVFYLQDVLRCSKGDKIKGTITAAPNETNHRDFDINFDVKLQGPKHSAEFSQEFRLR